MSRLDYRQTGEGAACPEKENAPVASRGDQGEKRRADSTASPDPLAGWFSLADDARKRQFRGKTKRRARAAVVQAKRGAL